MPNPQPALVGYQNLVLIKCPFLKDPSLFAYNTIMITCIVPVSTIMMIILYHPGLAEGSDVISQVKWSVTHSHKENPEFRSVGSI